MFSIYSDCWQEESDNVDVATSNLILENRHSVPMVSFAITMDDSSLYEQQRLPSGSYAEKKEPYAKQQKF